MMAFFVCGCEGPAGPRGEQGDQGDQGEQGEQGEQRENIEIVSEIITLPQSVDGYWILEFDGLLTECIINVYVRENPNILWNEPTWYLYKNTIWIADDEKADPGYECLINNAS